MNNDFVDAIEEGPHYKIWATVGNVFEDEETKLPAFRMIITGPDTHQPPTQTVTAVFPDWDLAHQRKKDIDHSPVPLVERAG